MLRLVGAGVGDPDLLTVRAVEVLAAATTVLADRSLWPLVRELAPGATVREAAPPASWPAGEGTVRLYPGDAVEASGRDRLALDRAGLAYELVPGVAPDLAARVHDALGAAATAARPLHGRRLVVTRPAHQQASLVAPLRRLGATVVSMPTIAIGPPDDAGAALAAAAAALHRYDWVVVTSANGARALLDAVTDARSLAAVRIAAIGPATAAVLAAARLPADLVPPEYVAESLLEVFPPAPTAPAGGAGDATSGTGRVLLARAAVARDTLPEGLRAAGWAVDVVAAYRTVAATVPDDVVAAARPADAVLFTSPSTVARFVERVGATALQVPPPYGPAVVAIGPVTAAAARDAGVRVDLVAERYDVAGLVDAVCRWAGSAPARRGATGLPSTP